MKSISPIVRREMTGLDRINRIYRMTEKLISLDCIGTIRARHPFSPQRGEGGQRPDEGWEHLRLRLDRFVLTPSIHVTTPHPGPPPVKGRGRIPSRRRALFHSLHSMTSQKRCGYRKGRRSALPPHSKNQRAAVPLPQFCNPVNSVYLPDSSRD